MAGDDDGLVRQASSLDPNDHQYPFAAAPDIIRSDQKDQYFQGVLLEQLSNILRKAYGSRFMHTYTSETRTVADLLYLGLTTLVGNRTLGEEYCDIVQVDDTSRALPSIRTRAGYIVTFVLFPYALNRALPSIRRRLRSRLEAALARSSDQKGSSPPSSSQKLSSYLLANLDTLTSPSTVAALSLATFYFSGAYYHLSKRLWRLRYIFARQVSPTDPNRAGYEVLGVLLVLQLAVQSYLHLRSTLASANGNEAAPPALANQGSLRGSSALLSGGVEVSLDPLAYSRNNTLLFEADPAYSNDDAGSAAAAKMRALTHTPAPRGGGPAYDLADEQTLGWVQGRQARKCTLCLEPMKDPAVTTCGHVFCWVDIVEWCREKAECPLCRQVCLVQKILPLRG